MTLARGDRYLISLLSPSKFSSTEGPSCRWGQSCVGECSHEPEAAMPCVQGGGHCALHSMQLRAPFPIRLLAVASGTVMGLHV